MAGESHEKADLVYLQILDYERLDEVRFPRRPCEAVQDMLVTPLYQQHASHTLAASRVYGPQPHNHAEFLCDRTIHIHDSILPFEGGLS